MSFEPMEVTSFMGGVFSIDNQPKTAEQLAIMFDEWAKEARSWGSNPSEVGLSDVCMKDKLHVTLDKGIY